MITTIESLEDRVILQGGIKMAKLLFSDARRTMLDHEDYILTQFISHKDGPRIENHIRASEYFFGVLTDAGVSNHFLSANPSAHMMKFKKTTPIAFGKDIAFTVSSSPEGTFRISQVKIVGAGAIGEGPRICILSGLNDLVSHSYIAKRESWVVDQLLVSAAEAIALTTFIFGKVLDSIELEVGSSDENGIKWFITGDLGAANISVHPAPPIPHYYISDTR